MNPVSKDVRPWLVPLLILALGTGGSWSLSQAFRQDALRAWEAQAEQAARGLSGTLLGWLEESYAPLSGLAVLAENSTTLSEVEFLNAFDALEARATAFFLDSAAYLRLDRGKGLHLVFSTDIDGPLAAGAPAENLEQALYVSADLPQTGRVMVKDEDLCVHCSLCAERCPTGAWDMQKSQLLIPYAADESPEDEPKVAASSA